MQDQASTPDSKAVPPTATLADRVRRAAEDRPAHPALVWRDQTISWAELDFSVDRVADTLRRTVPGPPDGQPARVAIALTNSPDFVVTFFATLRAGLVAVPVNPESTARELGHVLSDSGAALLVCTERVRDLVAGLGRDLPALRAVHTGPPTGERPTDAPGPVDQPASPPGPVDQPASPRGPVDQPASPRGGPGIDDLAVLLYTSGTEGQPKGAMLSHRALLANHGQIERISPRVVGPDDRVLLALPLFHVYGLNTGLGSVAYHGACGVLVDRFDPAATLEVIARQRVSVVVGVPAMFLGWSGLPGLDAALAPVRLAVCGAAPLEPATSARFSEAAGRPIFVGYGLTETAPVLTSTLASTEPKAGSIGGPIPDVEVRLVGPTGEILWSAGSTGPGGSSATATGAGGRDAVDTETDVDEPDVELFSPGTDPGEIVVRGPNLFSGYWPDGRDGPDADGWWATGDVAYADADGDLHLVDRLGELILVNGFNVYPREVELVLDAHPAVVESAVVGQPDPRTGQAVKAYVVRVDGGAVTEPELLGHCARNLARFKRPSTVEFVTALPHSVIGKVRKTLLRSSPAESPDTAPEGRLSDA